MNQLRPRSAGEGHGRRCLLAVLAERAPLTGEHGLKLDGS
jgi:hypothetical protein